MDGRKDMEGWGMIGMGKKGKWGWRSWKEIGQWEGCCEWKRRYKGGGQTFLYLYTLYCIR